MIENYKEKTSPLKTVYLEPKKIIYKTNGVYDAENLINNSEVFTDMGKLPLTRLSNENGKTAKIILDFGCELSGGILISTRSGSERIGMDVLVRFGESAMEAITKDGVKGACSDHSIREFTVKLPWNSTQTVGKTGFRFVCIELLSSGFCDIISIKAAFSFRDLPYLGSFSCNDQELNRIYDTCAYTLHLNMQEMLWDGIKRDRMVWIGDMHPEMLTMRTVFGYNSLIDDCLRYTAKTYPLPGWPNNITGYGMWYILILNDWYQYNGDKNLVVELKEYWLGLIEQLISLVHSDGDVLRKDELARGFFLDWPTNGKDEAAAGIVALLRLTLKAGNNLCNLINENDLANKCQNKAEELKRSTFKGGNEKQVIALMCLADLETKENASSVLLKGGAYGMSTFMSYYILQGIFKSSGIKDCLNILKQYYGGMLSVGATSFWEDFDIDWIRPGATIEKVLKENEYDIHGDNGRFCYCGFRHSLCHGWSSGPAAFLAEKVLGIEIKEPGCRKISIHPNLGDLEWVKGTYPTPFGVVNVYAQNVNGEIKLEVDAPKTIVVE